MHIAFFNRSYYPDQTATGQLLTELAETLVGEHGCRVTVVTGPPLSPAATTPGGATAAWPPRETRNGVCIVRARGTRFNKRRFAGRAANYMTYFASACVAGVRLDRPDVVVALTDPPVIGIAAWIAGRRAGASARSIGRPGAAEGHHCISPYSHVPSVHLHSCFTVHQQTR